MVTHFLGQYQFSEALFLIKMARRNFPQLCFLVRIASQEVGRHQLCHGLFRLHCVEEVRRKSYDGEYNIATRWRADSAYRNFSHCATTEFAGDRP